MMQPTSITVRGGSAYIQYHDSAIIRTDDVLDSDVTVDIDAAQRVVGIEILDVIDPEQLEAARTYALKKSLAFPRDLRGSLSDDFVPLTETS